LTGAVACGEGLEGRGVAVSARAPDATRRTSERANGLASGRAAGRRSVGAEARPVDGENHRRRERARHERTADRTRPAARVAVVVVVVVAVA